ncbi:MAG: hypothetical protein QM630_09905 [Microbacterium sp.]
MNHGVFPPGVIVMLASVGVGLIFLHMRLSRRNPVWLGLIVPVVYVSGAGVMVFLAPPSGGLIVGYGLTLVALLIVWWAGEDERKRRRGDGAIEPSSEPPLSGAG